MTTNIHASCVALNGQGVLILGAPGSGKSDLCLRLINTFHALLVADDRVDLNVKDGELLASCPSVIKGMLEVRGVGIISCPHLPQVPLRLVVELAPSCQEVERLPAPAFYHCQEIRLPQIRLWPFEASAADKVLAALQLYSFKEN